jgi:hypothetical protein
LPSASVGLVAVFEPPGVAFERECSAWWTSRSIIAAAVTSSPEISPQPENGLLVTVRLARS